MGFRFRRRLKLAPGLTLNLGKRGGSLSLGPRGAKVTMGHGGVRRTLGLPGTGLSYTEKVGGSRRSGRSRAGGRRANPATESSSPTIRLEDRLDLGFFKRLITPKGEEDFADGMHHILRGEEGQAYGKLCKAVHLADGAFMAGVVGLKLGHFQEAIRYLDYARQNRGKLGRYFAKYGIDAAVSLPITEHIQAHIGPSTRGIALALAEAHQHLDQWPEAVRELEKLHRTTTGDPVVLLSLVELLVDEAGTDQACQRVVQLVKGVDNDSPLHAATLLWKGKALEKLGLHTAARDALTAAFRRKKDREEDLLWAIQYERLRIYQAMGKKRRYREELEKLYAEAGDYEDVAQRLGLKPHGA